SRFPSSVPRVRSPPPALSEALGMFSEVKTADREEARSMPRNEGRSIKEIARSLGVSTSSVSHWVRDIELTAEQHDALQAWNRLQERQRLARAAKHGDRPNDLWLDSRAGRLRPPGVARHASLTRLIRQRLQRPGGRLELARLEAGDDLAGEGPCLADLLDLEHGVDGREVIAVDQGQFDVDGVEISFCDVGILGNTDPHAHRPAVRHRRDRLDRFTAQAHALRILAQRAI